MLLLGGRSSVHGTMSTRDDPPTDAQDDVHLTTYIRVGEEPDGPTQWYQHLQKDTVVALFLLLTLYGLLAALLYTGSQSHQGAEARDANIFRAEFRQIWAPLYWLNDEGEWQYRSTAPAFVRKNRTDIVYDSFNANNDVSSFVEIPNAPFVGQPIHKLKVYNDVQILSGYAHVCVHSLTSRWCPQFLVPCPVPFREPTLQEHAEYTQRYRECEDPLTNPRPHDPLTIPARLLLKAAEFLQSHDP